MEIQGTPGVVSYRVLEAPGRGLAVQGDQLYALAGTSLYRVSDGSSVGTIPGSGTAMFAAGPTQLVTDNGYIFDGAVSKIADVDLPPLAAVDFVDGYVVGVEKGTGRFVGSALNDASDWSGLDYATAEARPDLLTTLRVSQRDVVLIGKDTTEIWWNSGQDGFPFARQAGGFLELGTNARLGVTQADNTLWMFGADRTFRALRGRSWVKVSQTGVEEAVARYATVNDCEAYSFTHHGIVHVCFRFPTEGITWCHVVNTGEWYEADTGWVCAISHNGKTWVQHLDGTVGYLTDSTPAQFGSAVIRTVVFPNVYSENARAFHSSLDVILRTGDADTGVTPMVQLDISDDGGNTWTSLPSREMGLIGQYRKVVRWFRLGTARDRVYRIRVSDAVPFHLLGAELEVVGGAK